MKRETKSIFITLLFDKISDSTMSAYLNNDICDDNKLHECNQKDNQPETRIDQLKNY